VSFVVNGVDLSDCITGCEIEHRYDELSSFALRAVTMEMSFNLTPEQAALMSRAFRGPGPPPEEPVQPTPTRHPFEQDPDEAPARLCGFDGCGMWPEHHNHGGYSCHCQVCQPSADYMSERSIYTEADYAED
jgi:hypothetical protein